MEVVSGIVPKLRPWYPPCITMTLGLPVACLASFKEFSTASAPVVQKKSWHTQRRSAEPRGREARSRAPRTAAPVNGAPVALNASVFARGDTITTIVWHAPQYSDNSAPSGSSAPRLFRMHAFLWVMWRYNDENYDEPIGRRRRR